ncbi:hypothetical protein CCACVL1_22401 [Corchorus capsularis]|uniref:Uncharacterized protein n=1 Tax=Corchorus capsularis TaxID=210143 RepID=A0A1R3GZE0_COCAP|nr:hypothetical protein CCACVL1_22401 [Corchorus capsularis]
MGQERRGKRKPDPAAEEWNEKEEKMAREVEKKTRSGGELGTAIFLSCVFLTTRRKTRAQRTSYF